VGTHKPRASVRVHVCTAATAAGTASAAANKGKWAQTEGTQGQTSVNRHKPKARKVEQACMSTSSTGAPVCAAATTAGAN